MPTANTTKDTLENQRLTSLEQDPDEILGEHDICGCNVDLEVIVFFGYLEADDDEDEQDESNPLLSEERDDIIIIMEDVIR